MQRAKFHIIRAVSGTARRHAVQTERPRISTTGGSCSAILARGTVSISKALRGTSVVRSLSSVIKSRRGLCASLALLAIGGGGLGAQTGQPPKPSDPAECYGFSFGKWTPPLDWQLSGHGALLDSARVPRAPNGRGWAASDIEVPSDTSLLLFPPWWPAGVLVVFKTKPTKLGDTAAGEAMAFVADARKQPSTSSIRGWLVRCQP